MTNFFFFCFIIGYPTPGLAVSDYRPDLHASAGPLGFDYLRNAVGALSKFNSLSLHKNSNIVIILSTRFPCVRCDKVLQTEVARELHERKCIYDGGGGGDEG